MKDLLLLFNLSSNNCNQSEKNYVAKWRNYNEETIKNDQVAKKTVAKCLCLYICVFVGSFMTCELVHAVLSSVAAEKQHQFPIMSSQ